MASLPPALIFSTAQLSLAVVSCLGYWLAGVRMMRSWDVRASEEHIAGAFGKEGGGVGAKERGVSDETEIKRGARKIGGESGAVSKEGVSSCETSKVGGGGGSGFLGGGGRMLSWGPAEREALATSGIFAVQAVSLTLCV